MYRNILDAGPVTVDGTVHAYRMNPTSGEDSYLPAMDSTLEVESSTVPLPVTDHLPSPASSVYRYTCVTVGARVSATHSADAF